MKRLLFTLTILSTFSLFATAQTKYEAEAAQHSNCDVVSGSKYSGGKAVKMTENNATLSFTIPIDKRGKYIISVAGDGIGGGKVVNCTVNGSTTTFQLNTYEEVRLGTFILKEGNNTVVITPNWTWFDIDYLLITPNENTLEFNIAEAPVDANATNAARVMYGFLLENFGKRTISGIMTGEMGSSNTDVKKHADVQAVYSASGKYPALIGFDFMNATGKSESTSWNKDYTRSSMNLAKDTYRKGGFPAFTWHWRDPSRNTDAFYTSDCNMKISNALKSDGTWNTSSSLYKYIIKDIDAIADYFLELQKAGMACIFRPLHEASGGWFWWGREGAEPCKKLYRLMYDEMVNVKGVHNVIWVWNAGDNDKDWNPGDDYYDIVSADIYNGDFDYSSNYVSFDNLKTLTNGKKIIALSENGPIPDIQNCVDDESVWSWWMPWYQTWNGKFVDKTSKAEWSKCMHDERVITLEDLSAGWEVYAGIEEINVTPTPSSSRKTRHIITDMQGRILDKEPMKGLFIKDGVKRFK